MIILLSNYSFIDDLIAGSAMPYDLDDIQQYLDDGIKHLVSLTPKQPLVSRYYEGDEIQFHHFPVYATPDNHQIRDFLDVVNRAKTNGEKIVVHCQYGQERTGIFLVAYLVEIKNINLNEAITMVKETRDSSLQTHHALKFLKDRYS